mmetsp:Transcript_62189/g.131390  ORF Transcript_62189/g.131390 Transcript_62189/m.131390 type:complete len:226 (-) Transcript_62189:2066-2743(-)
MGPAGAAAAGGVPPIGDELSPMSRSMRSSLAAEGEEVEGGAAGLEGAALVLLDPSKSNKSIKSAPPLLGGGGAGLAAWGAEEAVAVAAAAAAAALGGFGTGAGVGDDAGAPPPAPIPPKRAAAMRCFSVITGGSAAFGEAFGIACMEICSCGGAGGAEGLSGGLSGAPWPPPLLGPLYPAGPHFRGPDTLSPAGAGATGEEDSMSPPPAPQGPPAAPPPPGAALG